MMKPKVLFTVISTMILSTTVAQSQWFGKVTKVLKDVEISRCYLLGEISEEFIQRTSTGTDYDQIEGQYPYQERTEHIIFFTDPAEREVQEKRYHRLTNQIEKISISEKLGNEATIKSRLQNFIKLKKAFACKEVQS